MSSTPIFSSPSEPAKADEPKPEQAGHSYICDRCGHTMHEGNCKITCSNCGNRFDCSDLNIYFD
jgi:hypothetical protein